MNRRKVLFVILFVIAVLVVWRIAFHTPAPAVDDKAAEKVKEEADGGEGSKAKEDKAESDKKGEKQDADAKPEDKDPNAVDEDDPLEAINLNNVEMKDIIQKIGDWTGKPVIPVSDDVMKVKITIYSSEKVTRSTALSLIYDALRAKGFIAEYGTDKIFLKPLAQARLGTVPTLGVDEPLAKIMDKSQIVEKFFKLRNYNAARVVEIIAPLTAEYGHVTAIESTGNVAVIDTVENLMRIERIIKQLDVPESEQMVEEIFVIEEGDPIEIVGVLEMILAQDRRQTKKGKAAAPAAKDSKPATSVVISSTTIEPKFLPIPKRNWIIARASAEDMKRISDWIEKLDIKESVQAEQTIMQIRYADVREVVNIVNRTLRGVPGAELKTSVIVEGQPQSKQIIIFGSEENRKRVEKLIAEIDLPVNDVFVQETFPLEHADPDQIKKNIDELFEDINANVSSWRRRWQSSKSEDTVKVISYPTLSQVTVIASENNMEKIRTQIAEWDVPLDVEKDQYMILTLRNSDPVQMVELLTTLFTEESSTRTMPWWWWGGGDDQKKKIVGSLYGMLTFEAVPDTKKIIVISKIPQAYDIIEDLVKRLDSQEMAEVPRVITLKYADSEDLCEQLNAILNEPGTPATIRRSTRGLSDYSTDDEEGTGGNGDNQNTASANTITPWWNKAQNRRNEEMPASNLIGKIRFIPVHRSKAILVLAPPEYLESIEAMIIELDQPGKQVMIKAVIVDIGHSDMTSIGVQLATNSDAFGTLGENALRALTNMTNISNIGSFTFDTTLDINILIDLLVKKADARILNQPTLWTKDNEEAVFIKAQEIAFISGSQSDTTGTSIKDEIQYRDVGITMRLRPNITPEKAVDITIDLEISELEDELINNQIATNKLNTTTHLIVEDGQTILIGGILFQKDSLIERKIPLLGDLPILGGFFSHEDTVQTNNELLVFITPYVVDSDSSPETVCQLEEPRKRMEAIVCELDRIFAGEQEEVVEEIVEEIECEK